MDFLNGFQLYCNYHITLKTFVTDNSHEQSLIKAALDQEVSPLTYWNWTFPPPPPDILDKDVSSPDNLDLKRLHPGCFAPGHFEPGRFTSGRFVQGHFAP